LADCEEETSAVAPIDVGVFVDAVDVEDDVVAAVVVDFDADLATAAAAWDLRFGTTD